MRNRKSEELLVEMESNLKVFHMLNINEGVTQQCYPVICAIFTEER